MLKSEDGANKAMGLEIMANCNIAESHTFIALLFYFWSEDMKLSKNWNHVNF